jgi:hypothetical protein
VSPGTLLRLDLTGRTFGQDASNGNDVYQTGTQFEIDATFARATPSWTLLLRGRNVTRSDDEIISGAGDDLVRTIVTAPGSLWGFAEAYYLLSPASALGAELHAGTFGEAETYLSDGSSIGVGPAFRLGRIDARRVLVRALYLTGDAEGGTIDLSGFDVSIAAAFPF